ncbi:hypothetical protein AB0M83_04725 [Amycolatopsis sp. NPDC051106]|uniref:hypothetical protein n=1 Tax=unclassified Amycolatopsis TaxID=2618356 RepID=UPI00343DD30E
MATRRSRGDGGLYWDESRQRWTAEVTVGFGPNGKCDVRKAHGKTKTEAKNKLKELLSDIEEDAANASAGYTVAQAVNDWLDGYERGEWDPNTVKAVRSLANNHIIPAIGARPLVKLDVDDVEEWLAAKAEVLVTSTLRNLRSILRRAINRAQVRKRFGTTWCCCAKSCRLARGPAGRRRRSRSHRPKRCSPRRSRRRCAPTSWCRC